MADTTTRYNFPYQELTDAPDGASLGQDLAEAVEDALGAVDDAVTVLEGRRVGTTTATADVTATSSTTEKAVDQVTISAVSGRRYALKWVVKWAGTTANDEFVFRLRTGSGTGGTELQSVIVRVANAQTYTDIVDMDWTAGSTGSQTFTGTVQRITGSGTLTPKGSSTVVRILTVERID